jgi:hypothetical protein
MSYITKCAGCGKEIRLQKDSTEGQQVWHGQCFEIKEGKK